MIPKIYKYMKEIYIESPYNGGDNALTRHLMPTSKLSNGWDELHHVETLVKEVPKAPVKKKKKKHRSYYFLSRT